MCTHAAAVKTMNLDKLISEIAIRRALWVLKQKDYHNRHVINKLWVVISKNIN